VAHSQRSSFKSADRRGLATSRNLAIALGALAILWSLLIAAAPAGAVVSAGFGLQQRKAVTQVALEGGGPLRYHGGPVLHSTDAYVIYWNPTGGYRGDWERLIDRYFRDVGVANGRNDNVFALDTQYNDAGGPAANKATFRGSYTDSNPFPTSAEGGNCIAAAQIVCLTDQQIKAELQHVITSVAPPLPGATGTPVYYLLTPPGVTVCTDSGTPGSCSNSAALESEVKLIEEGKAPAPASTGICGYHAVANEGGGAIPYVVQPWVAGNAGLLILRSAPLVTSQPTSDALACQDGRALQEPNQLTGLNPFGNFAEGLADVIIADLSAEQQNVEINPQLNGWYQTSTSAEQADVCQFNFGPPPLEPLEPNRETHAANLSDEKINENSYYLPWGFDSADVTAGKGFKCWSGVALEPFFTPPNPVNAGDVVGFNSESNVTLGVNTKNLPPDEPYLAPVYTWDFGDGTSLSGIEDASEFHSYQYGGTYTVTLTVKDSGSNVASTTREVTVVGPPRPGSSTAGGGSTGSSGGAAPGSPGAGASTVTKPLVTAAIVSRSLKAAARKGLVVRYSVNEQVAGRFEVLIPSSVAKRLGISGSPATGMPVGSPAEIVVAKAILITTKGGRSTLTIPFSKRTSGRLQHTRKVVVTLRLIVHNAARTPASTTVVTAATLAH
jgi:hypothetical protein